jgi:uncharacterized protein (DUF58 family)
MAAATHTQPAPGNHGVFQSMRNWLFAMRGAEAEALLHHRRIFVLPSRAGLLFVAMLLALLVASINYQLSLGYLLTFGVGAFSWVGLQMTFANMTGLKFSNASAAPVFAGEMAAFEFVVADTRKRARFAIQVGSDAGEVKFHVARNESRRATLAAPATHRGWLNAPRATISTLFPLGLWRAWSYWQPLARCLVYPAPETDAPPLPAQIASMGSSSAGPLGDDSFAFLRPYVASDSPRVVAWKAVARSTTGTLVSKQFEGGSSGELWLDIAGIPGSLSHEQQLSRLCAWVLQADAERLAYGLRIVSCEVPIASGPAQRDACLKALALA